jgi:serine protease DegQ
MRRNPFALPLLLSTVIVASFVGGYVAQRGRPAADAHAPPLVLDAAATPAFAALPAQVDGAPIPSLAPMLERVMPAVVNIHSRTVVRVQNPLAADPLFRELFGLSDMPQERVSQSLGSGVVVDAGRGLVLTNNHVIAGATDIQVTLADGRTLTAENVGSDEDTDVALIRIPAEGLSAVPLAESDALRVGDFVVAVGNPFGLGQTVTSGIVSALGRTGLPGLGFQNFIQTDASINPGNSGGALVNLRGELVGINTAIFNPGGSTAGNIGIGFAIPSSLARDVMNQLTSFGEVRRGTLGLQTQDITAEIAQALDLGSRRGAVVTRVQNGSPAAAAGLRPGDVVVALNGRRITNGRDFHNAEGLLPVGRSAALTVLRDGEELEVSAAVKTMARQLDGATLDPRLAGAKLAALPERYRQQGVEGVLIAEVKPGSRAAANGLRAGDLITALNRRDVPDLATLQARLAEPPAQLMLTLIRGQRAYFAPLE